MTNSTRATLKDGASRLATLVAIGAALVQLANGSGCAASHAGHKHGVPKGFGKMWKPGKRCKQMGKAVTANVAVLVERNCLKNGVTTVGILVLNTKDKGKRAAKDAVQATVALLGFRPTLATIFVGKTHGKVFILSAVTGINNDRPRRKAKVTGDK